MSSISIPPHAVLFQKHWHAYRTWLHEDLGGRSKKWHFSVTALWRLHGTDIWNTYLDTVAGIAYPATCAALRTVMRLRDARRQRWLEKHGYLDAYVPSRTLPQLDDEQLDRFIELAQSRLERLLKPEFEPRFIHRLLWELGLFTYSGSNDPLSLEEVALLALSRMLTGQIGGNRKEIRKEHGIYRLQRVKHPMIKRTPKEILQRIWRYFQGGRVFLWISSVVYWSYWQQFKRNNTRLGEIINPVV